MMLSAQLRLVQQKKFVIPDPEVGLSEEAGPRAGRVRPRLQGLGADEVVRIQLVSLRGSKNSCQHFYSGSVFCLIFLTRC